MILSQHFGFSPANQKMYDIHHHQRTSQSPSCANQDMQIKSSMIEVSCLVNYKIIKI